MKPFFTVLDIDVDQDFGMYEVIDNAQQAHGMYVYVPRSNYKLRPYAFDKLYYELTTRDVDIAIFQSMPPCANWRSFITGTVGLHLCVIETNLFIDSYKYIDNHVLFVTDVWRKRPELLWISEALVEKNSKG